MNANFKPSSYEQYNCLIRLEKGILHSEWRMDDLSILNPRNNRFESITSLNSEEILNNIIDEVLDHILVKQVS